jgi:hypothetical protein
VIDAGIAEADGLALSVRKNRDIDITGKRNSDAGAVDSGSEFRAGVDVDDNAVLHEGDARRIGVDEAGGAAIATKIVTPIGSIEELGFEGALQRLGGDADLGCMCSRSQEKDTENQPTSHEVKNNGRSETG